MRLCTRCSRGGCSLLSAPTANSYYAGSVIKSKIFQLHQRSDPDRYLHVIAFIAHQFYRMQDNLVDTLLTTLQSHQNACQREHKDRCYARRHQRDDQLAGLLETIDASIVLMLRQIKQVVHDPTLTDAEKVGQVRHLLPADNDNEPAAMIALRRELDAGRSDHDYHDVLESRSLKLQNRITPIIRALVFQGEPVAAGLLAAIEHFKAKDAAARPDPGHETAVLSCVTGTLHGSRSTMPSYSPISPGLSKPAR